MEPQEMAVSALVVTMALLLARVALVVSIAVKTWDELRGQSSHLAALLSLIIMFLVVLCSIATIHYAHNGLHVPYVKAYMYVSILLIAFPLHVATECFNRAAIDGRQLRRPFSERLLRAGMVAVIVAFVAQILYLSYGFSQFEQRQQFGPQFGFILAANVIGLLFPVTTLRIQRPGIRLPLACSGLLASAMYLVALEILVLL